MSHNSSNLPRWLEVLLKEKFYEDCLIHEKEKKNFYCVDCCLSICSHCLKFTTNHSSHRHIQIRRYVRQEVMCLNDARILMNCDYVQCCVTNGARVVFLNQKLKKQPTCINCNNSQNNPYDYCSIYCKLQHILKNGGGISNYVYYNPEHRTLPEPDPMTPDTVLEPAGSFKTPPSGSGTSATGVDCRRLALPQDIAMVVMEKRTAISAFPAACRRICPPVSEFYVFPVDRQLGCPPVPETPISRKKNRRKGVPCRAPFF